MRRFFFLFLFSFSVLKANEESSLYCAWLGFEDLDSARQSQIEASIARSLQEEHHSQIGKGDDEDRFGKVAASPNLQNLTAHSIEGQRAFLQNHGFLWVRGFFSETQIDMLRRWTEIMAQAAQNLLTLSQSSPFSLQMLAKNLPGTLIVVPEAKDPTKVCRVEDMLSCYPEFHRFISGTITSYLSTLMNEPYALFKDKTNFKWPGGGAFSPHQDFPAYECFAPRTHITAMVCIDPATLENGCLHIASNWQDELSNCPEIDQQLLAQGMAILPYTIGSPKHGAIKTEISDKLTWTPLEAKAGDVIFFTSYIPHYSEPNHSTKPRRAMFFTHNPLSNGDHREAYYHAKRNDPDNPVFHFATPTKARDK